MENRSSNSLSRCSHGQGEIVVNFVTSNQGKFDEAVSILSGSNITIKCRRFDMPEMQGDPDFICKSKCQAAASTLKGPVIVDDTSLSFDALHGLPGPYIKYFYEKLGSDGLYKLLAGFEDKSASAICTFAFSEGPIYDVHLFHGETRGTIVEPKGSEGFGWDSCFLPQDSEKTFAEMSLEEKNAISHRRKALNKLKLFFDSGRDLTRDCLYCKNVSAIDSD